MCRLVMVDSSLEATNDLLRGHFFAHGTISEAYICHYNGSFINNVLMFRS